MAKTSPEKSHKSAFSNWGSARTASHGSHKNAGDDNANYQNWNDGQGSTGRNSNSNQGNDWNNTSNNNWVDPDKTNRQQHGANADYNANNNGQDNWNNTGQDTWNSTGQDTWNNNNNDGSWDNTNTGGPGASYANNGQDSGYSGDNNVAPTQVMPGAWDTGAQTWGDPTMAASTGGQVDNYQDTKVDW